MLPSTNDWCNFGQMPSLDRIMGRIGLFDLFFPLFFGSSDASCPLLSSREIIIFLARQTQRQTNHGHLAYSQRNMAALAHLLFLVFGGFSSANTRSNPVTRSTSCGLRAHSSPLRLMR